MLAALESHARRSCDQAASLKFVVEPEAPSPGEEGGAPSREVLVFDAHGEHVDTWHLVTRLAAHICVGNESGWSAFRFGVDEEQGEQEEQKGDADDRPHSPEA